MTGPDDIKTAAIKACGSCADGILDRDRFCRWCGELQGTLTTSLTAVVQAETALREPSRYLTTELGCLAATTNLHRVSGPLVSAVVATLATGPVSRPNRSFFATAIAALLSLPLWLMIVLLSPFDAYAAAKNLSRGL